MYHYEALWCIAARYNLKKKHCRKWSNAWRKEWTDWAQKSRNWWLPSVRVRGSCTEVLLSELDLENNETSHETRKKAFQGVRLQRYERTLRMGRKAHWGQTDSTVGWLNEWQEETLSNKLGPSFWRAFNSKLGLKYRWWGDETFFRRRLKQMSRAVLERWCCWKCGRWINELEKIGGGRSIRKLLPKCVS